MQQPGDRLWSLGPGHSGGCSRVTPFLLLAEEGSSFGRGYPLIGALRAVPCQVPTYRWIISQRQRGSLGLRAVRQESWSCHRQPQPPLPFPLRLGGFPLPALGPWHERLVTVPAGGRSSLLVLEEICIPALFSVRPRATGPWSGRGAETWFLEWQQCRPGCGVLSFKFGVWHFLGLKFSL